MSGDATTWAKAQECPTPRAKAVLKSLATYADVDGLAWASIEVLLVETSLGHERTVQRGLSDLKRVGLITDTGEKKVHFGRLYPIYQLSIDSGPANTRQALALRRAARGDGVGVTPVSPQGGARGDTHVTPGATPVSPRGVTPVSPKQNQLDSQFNSQSASAQAQADEQAGAAELDPAATRAFEALVGAWPAGALDNTDLRRAGASFAAILPEVGDPARLVAAGRDYLAEMARQKRDYPPAALHSWLERGSWRHRLGKAHAGARVWRFNGPDALRQKLSKRLGERAFGSWIEPCAWSDDPPTLLAANGVAFDWITKNLGPWLAEEGVAIGRVKAGAVQ